MDFLFLSSLQIVDAALAMSPAPGAFEPHVLFDKAAPPNSPC